MSEEREESTARIAPLPWGWHLGRASSLVLLVVVPVHLVSTVLLTDPATADIPSITERWQQPAWQVLDWLVVVVGLTHAALAVAGRSPTTVRWLRVAVVVWCAACAALALAATVAIATIPLS